MFCLVFFTHSCSFGVINDDGDDDDGDDDDDDDKERKAA